MEQRKENNVKEEKYVFVKQNDLPLLIERVEDEHEEEMDYRPSFWWWNRRYHLETDFEPVQRSVYDDGIPESITLVESGQYADPMFLELPDEEHVNIYKERRACDEEQ